MIGLLLSPLGKWLGAAALLIAAVAGFKVWLINHDATVKAGLVAQYEAQVAEAKAAEIKRQSEANAALLKAAQAKTDEALASEAAIKANIEIRIADYEKRLADEKRRCDLTDDDVRTIMHDNKPASQPLGHK